jgi:pre-rRNA-processing protein IPI3
VGGTITNFITIKIATGNLVRNWEGHYKKVTSIVWTDDDSTLVSAAEDTVIHSWNLFDILDTTNNAMTPIQSFSDHSLPITALHCGVGGNSGMLISISMDRTCKV